MGYLCSSAGTSCQWVTEAREGLKSSQKHFLAVGGHRHGSGVEMPMAAIHFEPCEPLGLKYSNLFGRWVPLHCIAFGFPRPLE